MVKIIVLSLLHISWLMGISSFIVLFDDIKEYVINSKSHKNRIKKSREQYPEDDCRHYLFANFRAKHASTLYTVNDDLDTLVNQVLDEEILNIYKSNYFCSDINNYLNSGKFIFNYAIETSNHTLTYWHHNLFYGMATNGCVRNKNGREIYSWHSTSISKKTRHRLYQIEESIRGTYEDEEFPLLYDRNGKCKINNYRE